MKSIGFLLLCLFPFAVLQAQDPTRFENEIAQYRTMPVDSARGDLIVFTGSSSVRMWRDVADDFPGYAVLNRGFGGSVMSDLLYYADDLILKLRPRKVFIYEGDNDLAGGKNPRRVVREAKRLSQRIRKESPGTAIYFISAKPSLARWDLRAAYEKLNQLLARHADRKLAATFVDVWNPMIDPATGEVFRDIFLDDGLHMNRKGYDIWAGAIRPFVER